VKGKLSHNHTVYHSTMKFINALTDITKKQKVNLSTLKY